MATANRAGHIVARHCGNGRGKKLLLTGGGGTTEIDPSKIRISATGKTNIIAGTAIARGDLLRADGTQIARAQAKMRRCEDADLIIAVRKGRERWNHLNPLPIHEIHDRWIGPHAADATARLAKLRRQLERDNATLPAVAG